MKTLFKLELQKNIIRTYVAASLIIAFTMLGFLYLFAYAPMLEPNDKDMAIFSGYHNLIPLFGVLNMAVFCVLSAVMYSKFIIEDYTGKRIIFTFLIPGKPKENYVIKARHCISLYRNFNGCQQHCYFSGIWSNRTIYTPYK